MKHGIWMFTLVCAIVVAGAPNVAIEQQAKPAARQYGSVQAEMLKDWSDLKASLLKLADYMPAEKYGFVPAFPAENLKVDQTQESFARRLVVVAQVNFEFLAFLGGKAMEPPS